MLRRRAEPVGFLARGSRGRDKMTDVPPKLAVVGGSVALDGADSLPLNERAYELIRLDILMFRLKPGEKTSERLLATRYGLGMASIRAALPRLVQEGFVEKSAERGTLIAPLTLRGVRETYQMRYMLEPAAAEIAAERGMDVARLDGLRQACEARWADEEAAVSHILLANRDFNLAIAEATGNALLAKTIGHLQNLSLRILFLGTVPTYARQFWSTGPAMIRDAIAARNGPLARELYTADLAAGERSAVNVITALPEIENINLVDLNSTRSLQIVDP
jgi:DNA-binding GntR family transcriptional regulator